MRSLRNFFITFGISLIIFGLIGWLIWSKLDFEDDKQPTNEGEQVNIPVNNFPVKEEQKTVEEDGFTALLCCYDDTIGRADSIVLVNVNKGKEKFTVCSIPTYLKLNIGTEAVKNEVYLGDILIHKGRNFFLEKLEAITGLPVDYYVFMSSLDFVNIINEIGGIEYNVPQRMYYKNTDGKVLVNLQAGLSRLSGEEALQLVRYRSYAVESGQNDDGDAIRRQTQCEFLYKVLTSFLKKENKNSIDGIVKNLLDLIVNGNTNFTVTTFIRHKDLIFNFEEYGHEIIQYPISATRIETLYNGEKLAVHTPNIKEAVENVFSEYRTVRAN